MQKLSWELVNKYLRGGHMSHDVMCWPDIATCSSTAADLLQLHAHSDNNTKGEQKT